MALVSFADNVVHNLTGQYTFRSPTHRATSSARLRVGGATITPTAGPAATLALDASLSSMFFWNSGTVPVATVVTVSNMVDGQVVRVFIFRATDDPGFSFAGTTGTVLGSAGAGTDLFSLMKVGSTIYLVNRPVVAGGSILDWVP